MSLQLKSLHSVFVAEASGIDISQPLSAADVAAIDAAMNEHAVLVWRNCALSGHQQLAFAKSFGPIDLGLKKVFRRPERLERLLEVIECDAGCEDPPHFAPRRSLMSALQAVRRVDAGKVARENPDDIPGALRRARLMAIAERQPPSGH